MARTIDQIQADIDAVSAEAATQAREQHWGDRGQTNRSEDDRQKALRALRAEMDVAQAAAGSGTRTRQLRCYSTKGL